jgi:hypothetical protein
MCISNRQSRRKQNKATLKNNSKSIEHLPVQFTPITDYEVAREATNALMSYLRRAFHEYTHALKPRHIASMQLAIALHTGDEHVRRCAAHFPRLAGPLEIELVMIERQLGSLGLN